MNAACMQRSWAGAGLPCRGPSRPAFWALPASRLPLRPPSNHGVRTPHAAPVASTSLAPQQSPQTDCSDHPPQASFDWRGQWYPLAIVGDLDPGRPAAAKLLGRSLVLWRDRSATWRAFEDACPHRLVPLSEGRIEDGTLQCSYHGWRFDGGGQCVAVPQAPPGAAAERACANARACATSYPTQVRHGLLWVWPQGGPEAHIAAAAVEPSVISELEAGQPVVQVSPWFMRDLPYGADVLAENLLDPAHVPFSHHGVLGNRGKVSHFELEPSSEVDVVTGFSVAGRPAAGQTEGSMTMEWRPPCLVRAVFRSTMRMISYCVPTEPGRSRLFFLMYLPADKVPWYFRLAEAGNRVALWANHLGQHRVLDGDNVFLHGQDGALQARGGARGAATYYLPTSQDVAVARLRNWFRDCAGGGPWGAAWGSLAGVAPPLDRAQALDRYSTHTQHCRSCSSALRTVTQLQQAALAVAVAAAGGVLYLAAAGARLPQPQLLALGAVALAAVAARGRLADLRQAFYFVDYVHADKD